jgi:hypothetical protein
MNQVVELLLDLLKRLMLLLMGALIVSNLNNFLLVKSKPSKYTSQLTKRYWLGNWIIERHTA